MLSYRAHRNQNRIKQNNNGKRRRHNENEGEHNNNKKRPRPNESDDEYTPTSSYNIKSWTNEPRRTSRLRNLKPLYKYPSSSSDDENQYNSNESFVPTGASKKEYPVQFINGVQLQNGVIEYNVHWDKSPEKESSYTSYVDGCQETICDFWCLKVLKELIKHEEQRREKLQKIHNLWNIPQEKPNNDSVVGALNSFMKKCGEVFESNNNKPRNHNNLSRECQKSAIMSMERSKRIKRNHNDKPRIQNDKKKMDLDVTYVKTITKKGAKEKYHCIIHTDKANY